MASQMLLAAASMQGAAGGLSGPSVRASVEAQSMAAPGLEAAVQQAAALVRQGVELTSATAGRGVAQLEQGLQTAAQAGEQAAAVKSSAVQTAAALGQSSFSWSSYVQAIGVLFLLLAALWLAVWLIRRYGKFNFLPRPGALPRDALVMEAQLPLGPRKGLMVVRFLNRRLLLGVTDQQITFLTEEDAHHEPQKDTFHKIMEDAQSGSSADGGPAAPSA